MPSDATSEEPAADFQRIVSGRRSCREYLPDPVPESMLANCLEAARLAPSSCNRQPWRFIAVDDRAKLDAICGKALLPGIPMPWLRTAPMIVALCVQRSIFAHRIAPLISGVGYHLIDAGIAGEHFVLAAHAQGLGSCWIGWFKSRPLKRILGIPWSVKPVSLICLGFPAEQKEPRPRRELNEIASVNFWDNPFRPS